MNWSEYFFDIFKKMAASVKGLGVAVNWLERFFDELVDFYYKSFVAYGMVAVCSFTILAVGDKAPIWPLNYYTLVWTLALLFPLTAAFYLVFNLRIRLREIQDVSQRNHFYFVYFPDVGREESEQRFLGFLRRRFWEYYNLLELAAFSLVAGAIAFLVLFFLAVQLRLPSVIERISVPSAIDTWVLVIGSSFFGSLSGACVLVLKKYRTFDIYPSTYLQVTVGLVVGTLAGGFLVTIWPATYTTFLAFATGFLTTININFLQRLLRDEFAKLTGAKLLPDIPTDLDRVLRNSEAIESLNNISIFSVAEFAKTEPVRIYLTMPQPIGVINGWIDEALLHYYFQARIEILQQAHILQFTQLLELLVEEFRPKQIRWRQQATITGDPLTDDKVAMTAKSIVDGQFHHRLLGLLSEKYRRAFFLPPA